MKDLFELAKKFIPYLKNYKIEFIIAIAGMIFASVGTAISAYLVKPVLDEIFINKDRELLYILPYAIIIVYAVKEIGRYVQVYYTAYIGQDVVRILRDELLRHILRQDMVFFHEYRTGELVSRNINDIERIRNALSGILPTFITQLVTAIGLLFVVFYQSLHLAIFSVVVMPLAIFPLSKLAKKMKKISRFSQEKISDITAKLNQIFSNIEIIKANRSEKFESTNFEKENAQYFKFNIKAVKISELTSPLMETIGSIGIAIVIIIGGSEVIDGQMSVGSFFSFLTALFMLYTPIKKISNIYNQLQDTIVAVDRTFFLLNCQPKITSGSEHMPDFIDSITYKNVSLKYKNELALKNINLNVKHGQVLALVGNSGGGKSSLVNLLLRFYDTSSGEIFINDKEIKSISLDELRKSISIVTQRIYVFNDTVAANVAYGQNFDEQKVIKALKLANAYDFVNNLENGIYTILDEFGAKLSGGQRQRLAIARAIYANPKILIFDEATSALDNQSEKKIIEALDELVKGRITFVIAHRLSTIKKADFVVLMKEGEILDIDTEENLEKNSIEFRKLKGLRE